MATVAIVSVVKEAGKILIRVKLLKPFLSLMITVKMPSFLNLSFKVQQFPPYLNLLKLFLNPLKLLTIRSRFKLVQMQSQQVLKIMPTIQSIILALSKMIGMLNGRQMT